MKHLKQCLICFAVFLIVSQMARADTYTVRVGTAQHVNVVDGRFLSFTVDPKYLFSSNEKYSSKESICMASSLTPAYIRIAGPSTSHMTFHNATITFTDLDSKMFNNTENTSFNNLETLGKLSSKDTSAGELKVSHWQWNQFVHWVNATGFDLVFALNNEEKMESGLWDPNTALDILTMAEKAGVGEIYWQLGYECRNQSIEDYLYDLETLRVISETFPAGETRGWRVVGGDVTRCLQADSKSDFKDYVTLSDDMLDAVLLHGNSSAQELDRLSEADRLKLLKRLSQSTTPLWITESPHHTVLRSEDEEAVDKGGQVKKGEGAAYNELLRAADWMTSLGYSARNGFAVHFRELVEEELYEPTLSFYMALLFKNLVGERVLNVDMDASRAVLFAHCTSLRHQPVSGAVTLYGANMDSEPARFSVKLSRKEEGGDVMQFILGQDLSGNIVVNGRAMYYEGDIRPVVKRLRPYKTLLINLPPRSFGFWVLANTNIDACHTEANDTKQEFVEAQTGDSGHENSQKSNIILTKRSIDMDSFVKDKRQGILDENDMDELIKRETEGLKHRIDSLNNELKNAREFFETSNGLNRLKRQIPDQDNERRKLKRLSFKHRSGKGRVSEDEPKPKFQLIRKILRLESRNNSRLFRNDRPRTIAKVFKNKVSKRTPMKPVVENLVEATHNVIDKVTRKRRNVNIEKQNLTRILKDDTSVENEIDVDSKDQKKLWKILHKIHEQLKNLPTKDDSRDYNEYSDYESDFKDDETIASHYTAKYKENSKNKNGLLKSTVDNVVTVLDDLNKNLNKFWNALNILQ